MKRLPFKSIVVVLASVLAYVFAPADLPEPARRVLAVFVLAALSWALGIIPLYATSLGTVVLVTFLLCRPGGVLGMDANGYQVFMLPFGSSIIMLFFGGLVLAQALQKYHLDRMIASRLLKTFGTHPLMLMWGFMLVTGVLSMWMSNTATTAMMMAMALPMLKQMDPKDPFRTGLLLSIPFAANIGGVATPIGTPPNAIAIGILANEGVRVSFLGWMKMALPLAIVMMTVTSGILYWMFKPKQNQLSFQISAPPRMDGRARLVMGIGLLTAVLWLTSEFHKVPSALIALLAAGLLSVTGLMDRDDFKNIDWDVLVLMWGGLSLGKALDISGLDAWIVGLPLFDQNGFLLIAVFCVLAIVLSTFMSNTATANLVVPVAVAIPGENHVLLAATIALSCSFAMALPISTPPNAIAFASKMLKSGDMLKAGLLVSAVSVALLLLGYRVMISGALFPGGINP